MRMRVLIIKDGTTLQRRRRTGRHHSILRTEVATATMPRSLLLRRICCRGWEWNCSNRKTKRKKKQKLSTFFIDFPIGKHTSKTPRTAPKIQDPRIGTSPTALLPVCHDDTGT
mmetsp:Transcript_13102/g.14043  ORF Transcript_13102/g.14043 Transcript_13102/m.14043 type:complete len:113 (-) Transcript_13102:119-457(-)